MCANGWDIGDLKGNKQADAVKDGLGGMSGLTKNF